MKINLIETPQNETHEFLPECINVITFSDGNFSLPVESDKVMFLKVLFTEEGDYRITSKTNMRLGTIPAKTFIFFVGKGASNQPSFVYFPTKKSWYVLTEGNVICED